MGDEKVEENGAIPYKNRNMPALVIVKTQKLTFNGTISVNLAIPIIPKAIKHLFRVFFLHIKFMLLHHMLQLVFEFSLL